MHLRPPKSPNLTQLPLPTRNHPRNPPSLFLLQFPTNPLPIKHPVLHHPPTASPSGTLLLLPRLHQPPTLHIRRPRRSRHTHHLHLHLGIHARNDTAGFPG